MKIHPNKLVAEALVGTLHGNDTVVSVSADRRGHRVLLDVCCNLCGTMAQRTTDDLRLSTKKRRCAGCRDKQVLAAIKSPLLLSREQWQSVFTACRKASFIILGAGVDLFDDIASETVWLLLLKGGKIVGRDGRDIGALAYSIALGVARHQGLGQRVFAEPVLDKDGDTWIDAIDVVEASDQDTDHRERRQLALDAMSAADKTFLLRHFQSRRKTAAGRDQFDKLVGKVQANYANLASGPELYT